MERHVENATAVAKWLEEARRGLVGGVPGLESSPWHERQQRYLPNGAGAILAFGIAGGAEAGRRFIEGLELFSHLANVGDVRSLAIHPASTTHSQLTEAEQTTTGVTPDLVRLSVGIESIDDILADLDAGFRAAKGHEPGPYPGVWLPGRRPGAASSPPCPRRRRPGILSRRGGSWPRSPSPTRPGARSTRGRSNAVLVLHALTGDSHAVGPGRARPPSRAGGTA
jgi:hypothetical protein